MRLRGDDLHQNHRSPPLDTRHLMMFRLQPELSRCASGIRAPQCVSPGQHCPVRAFTALLNSPTASTYPPSTSSVAQFSRSLRLCNSPDLDTNPIKQTSS